MSAPAPPPALVLVHGRGQQMPAAERTGPAAEAAFVAGLRRSWIRALDAGLASAGLPPVDPERVYFPYYGNAFADAVAAREHSGQPRPHPDLVAIAGPPSAEALILDAAARTGFTPARHAALAPAVAPEELADLEQAWAGYTSGEGIGVGVLLRARLVHAALEYLARTTGIPDWIIERFLVDVAYYLDDEEIRLLVLDLVGADVRRAAEEHGSVVLVMHSLGSVVGYDLLAVSASTPADVGLFCTAGSPLGFPVVERNVLPPHPGPGKRPGPSRAGAAVPWLDAHDPADFAALVHPLADFYTGDLREVTTENPGDPHAIEAYLGHAALAGPVGRALAGRDPW